MNNIPTYNFNNDTIKYKYLERVDRTPEYPDMLAYSTAHRHILRRNRSRHEESKSDKIKSAIGAIAGTVLPLIHFMKRQGIKNPFKINYDLKEMLVLSATSIISGVGFGLIGSDKESRTNKIKEGIFQFMNASIPTWLGAATLRWCETTKGLNNNFDKIITSIATVLIGMQGAASVSNIICDPKDIHPDRKLTFLDSLANIDDIVGVLVLAKFPIIEKLHIDKLLPAIYTICGYRAGNSN